MLSLPLSLLLATFTLRATFPHTHNTADEPVQPYDQLDDSAKGLIEAIQERQAYINAGWWVGREGGLTSASGQRSFAAFEHPPPPTQPPASGALGPHAWHLPNCRISTQNVEPPDYSPSAACLHLLLLPLLLLQG